MACEVITMPTSGRAIVCGTRSSQRCACGRRATQLCDWKVPTRRSGTCDKPVCTRCTASPTEDKDLCPAHAAAYKEWKAQRA